MPRALLLSPDDQAVSAITAVLEEMAVTCERPLDGVSAAKKLNSHNFDLVLVDCENLPAAKLIFDVCRRGTAGHNPVPVAIVDGRAGLPTAFRLGAELILTKPVAKDQARNTVRTAVARVKKEEPARVPQMEASAGSAQPETPDASTTGHDSTADLLTNFESTTTPASTSVEKARAMVAAAPAQTPSFPSAAPIAALSSTAVGMSAATSLASEIKSSEVNHAAFGESATILSEPKSDPDEQLSEDPVLAELENEESQPAPAQPALSAPVFSAYADAPKEKKKVSGPLIAILVLLLLGAGLYAAWMTQPAFRAIADTQIEKLLALAGMALNRTTAVPTPTKPAAQPVTVTAPAVPPVAINGMTQSPSDLPIASGAPAANNATSAGSGTAGLETTTPVVPATPTVTKPALTAPEASSAKTGPDATLPGSETVIVLSSKGAEKRLIRSVQPKYPAGSAVADGTVVLKTQVDETGRVTDAKVVEGNAALAESAINAVKQWKYRPYSRDGKAMPFETVVLIDFQHP